MNRNHKYSLLFLYFIIFSLIKCNIWDNIFSQTEASYPIMLTQSFNINVTLPQNLGFDANIDFNSNMKIITVKLSKSLLIQKVEFIKAQIDLQQLIVNVEQFLLGCQKFTLALEDQTNDNLKKGIDRVNVGKKQLFLVNLFFKFIGKYDPNNSGRKEGSDKQGIQAGILDFFKGNKIIDSIFDSGVLGDVKKNAQNLTNQEMNVFEFSIDFYKDPKKIIEKIKEAKDAAEEDFEIDEIGEFDLDDFDLDMIKFVIVTDGKTGEIVKAFKNRQMKEELEFSLKSKEAKKIQCEKQAKKLTMQDFSNGAKYLYENKDSLGDIIG